MRGDKIALVGRNGQGKSTLLKALLANAPGVDEADLSIDSGAVKWGHEAQIGYFAQDFMSSIQMGMTVNDWLHQFDEDATKEDIRGILGRMLFRGEEGMKMTDALSGGESARLLFCKLMLQKPNVLVLDEPSNHLDSKQQRAQPRPAKVRGHRPARHPRPRPHRRGRHPHLALRGRPIRLPHPRLQRPYAEYQLQMAARSSVSV